MKTTSSFWLIGVLGFAGCMSTMQHRLVVLAPPSVSASILSPGEISNAANLVAEVAQANHLESNAAVSATNVISFYIGSSTELFHNSKIYVAVRLDLRENTLVVSTTDSPPYSQTRNVRHISEAINRKFIARFGSSRVSEKTQTQSDPGWFE